MGSTLPGAAGTERLNLSREPVRVAIISHHAPTIVSFRGALIRSLVQRGAEVWVLAPDYTPEIKKSVCALGAMVADYPLHRTGMNPCGASASHEWVVGAPQRPFCTGRRYY
jgi:hypothetical protein